VVRGRPPPGALVSETPIRLEYVFECTKCKLKAGVCAPKNAPWLAKVTASCGVCGNGDWLFLGNRHQFELTVGTDTYDPDVRAAQKQRSRDEDQRRLDAGEVTREELRKENDMFHGATAVIVGRPKREY
jgi:transcription elongation factor Elf1